jgi:hypothetical protein
MRPVASMPGCHHPVSPTVPPQLGHGPTACGHDGNATTVTAAGPFQPEHHILAATTAKQVAPAVFHGQIALSLLQAHAPPGSRQRIELRSAILRI